MSTGLDLQFEVDQQACNGCGKCAADCPAHLIDMRDGHPYMPQENEEACYACQHCFAICPQGALTIQGLRPGDSLPLAGPDPKALESLILSRRSIRRYKAEDLDPAFIEHLLQVAWHAPTGVNAQQVRFTVVDSGRKLAQFRERLMARLGALVREHALPQGMEFFAEFVRLWEEEGVDVMFRGAPHLLVASAPAQIAAPVPDCLIALTTFDLLAQAHGVGTLWDGIAKWAINDLVPEARTWLGIPPDHVVGYSMVFGKPAVRYARTVQRRGALIHWAE
jgi:nitroreductase/NAD-dependent dihydropyrimidine dehydrogenase PreA subunit